MAYKNYSDQSPDNIFKKRYNAQIDSSSRKFVKQMEYYRFGDEQSPTAYNVEYGVEISMSRDDFEELFRDILKVDYIDEHARKIDTEYAVMRQQEQYEQQLRDANPALNTAYDKYKLILDMVSGRNNGKNS
jgi:hypothetical protein